MASKQRILIVDDDENIAELISLYLTKECYETKIVYDGESALSELSVFKPNLILLDLMLPGIDGYQVCREIRKNNNVPIIMLSAKGETFDKVLGLELGADDYIIKPFETKEMVARVKAVLRRYHMPQSIGVDSSNAKCVNYPDLSINLDNLLLIRCLQENSFLTIYGDMNISEIQEPLMYTLRESVRKSKIMPTGILKQYGELVTSS